MNINAVRVNAGAGLHPDYKGEILGIVRSDLTPRLMAEKLLSYHENDIAEALELMSREERRRLYSVLGSEALAGILEYSDMTKEYLSELGIRKRIDILGHMDAQAAVDYLRELDRTERSDLLELMDEERRRELLLLSSFDEDEIGSRMSTNYVSIPSGVSIRQAMRSLIDQAAEKDNISTIYVVDADGALSGAIDLKDLIIAREGPELSAITKSSYPYVYAQEQIEDCIERLRDYSEDSIPVLDGDNKLRGVLTSQDITKLVDDELGEDYAKLAGLSAQEDLREPLKKSMGKRLPWLIILLGLGLVVSSVVGAFEGVVAHLTLIISFQSLILDMAGNVGTQSLAVTIRVLMDEQLSAREKALLVLKESRVGLANGLILGLMSFVFIGLYLLLLKSQPAALAFSVSMCTGAALILSILLSSITGTVVPLAFKKLNVDPAVASGPLITTLNDLVAVVTYYGLAWLLLINIMGL
ncbi:MAG TPA: magnesium transporter [Candidatus Limivicinus faecipullorum]|nr:magnesium transporter [Candidatus Limivicinus faecipullorum]